jgi:hypothetical protein
VYLKEGTYHTRLFSLHSLYCVRRVALDCGQQVPRPHVLPVLRVLVDGWLEYPVVVCVCKLGEGDALGTPQDEVMAICLQRQIPAETVQWMLQIQFESSTRQDLCFTMMDSDNARFHSAFDKSYKRMYQMTQHDTQVDCVGGSARSPSCTTACPSISHSTCSSGRAWRQRRSRRRDQAEASQPSPRLCGQSIRRHCGTARLDERDSCHQCSRLEGPVCDGLELCRHPCAGHTRLLVRARAATPRDSAHLAAGRTTVGHGPHCARRTTCTASSTCRSTSPTPTSGTSPCACTGSTWSRDRSTALRVTCSSGQRPSPPVCCARWRNMDSRGNQ